MNIKHAQLQKRIVCQCSDGIWMLLLALKVSAIILDTSQAPVQPVLESPPTVVL